MTTETTEKQDHEIARVELAALFSKLQLESRAVLIGLREQGTSCGGKPWKHFAWTVIFWRVGHGPKVEVDFDWKAGTAHVHKDRFREGQPKAPNGAEVLGNICREYCDAIQQCFENWCADFGYDTDSRNALEAYEQCVSHGAELKKMGLTPRDIQALAELSARL